MTKNIYLFKLKNNLLDNIGWSCFQIGVLFLPSSALISYTFLLIALLKGSFSTRDLYWKEFWNYPLILVSFLMLVGCIGSETGWLAWLGLFNWVPFF